MLRGAGDHLGAMDHSKFWCPPGATVAEKKEGLAGNQEGEIPARSLGFV